MGTTRYEEDEILNALVHSMALGELPIVADALANEDVRN